MVTWSGTSGHMQVGIDIIRTPHVVNSWDSQVTITVNYYVRSVAWGYNDDQVLNLYGTFGGSYGYRMVSGRGQTVEIHVASLSAVWPTSYGGGPTLGFGAYVSGAFDGSAPNLAIDTTIPARPPSPPSPPGTPVVDSITGTTARVATWAAPSSNNGAGVDLYRVHIGTDPNFSGGTYNYQEVGPPTHLGGLVPNTTYYAMVIAHNAAGWSSWGGLRAFTTLNYPSPPGTPYAESILPDSVRVNFTGSTNHGGTPVDYYNIELVNGAYTAVLQSYNVAGGPVTFGGLTPGTLYYVRVRAHNAVGFSTQSGNFAFTTLSGAKILVNGAWVDATAYVLVSGSWNLATVYKLVNGAWAL